MLCFAPAVAFAAKITGKLIIAEEFTQALDDAERSQGEAERAYYWKQPNGVIPVRSPRVDFTSDIAVLLFKEGAGAPPPDEIASVKVHTGGLEKTQIVTRPGSTIKLRNVDPYDHELYSPDMKSFKPERQSNGAFRPIDFPEEGVFKIRCKLIPHFLGHVVVTKATQILEVAADGTIVPTDIETGNYKLQVVYAGKTVHEESIVVGQGKTPALQIKLQDLKTNTDDEKKGKTDENSAGAAK
jgi:hypothetical protein